MDGKILYTDYEDNRVGVALVKYRGEYYLVNPATDAVKWVSAPAGPARFSSWYKYNNSNPTFERLVNQTLELKVK